MVTYCFFFILFSSLKYFPLEPGVSLSKKEKEKNQNKLYGVRLELEYGYQCELMISNT